MDSEEEYLDNLYNNYLEKKTLYDFICTNNINLNNNITELQKSIDDNNNKLYYYQNIYIKESLNPTIKNILEYCNSISKLQTSLINNLISQKMFYFVNDNIITDLKTNIDELQDIFYEKYIIKKRLKKMNYTPEYSEYLFNISLENIENAFKYT